MRSSVLLIATLVFMSGCGPSSGEPLPNCEQATGIFKVRTAGGAAAIAEVAITTDGGQCGLSGGCRPHRAEAGSDAGATLCSELTFLTMARTCFVSVTSDAGISATVTSRLVLVGSYRCREGDRVSTAYSVKVDPAVIDIDFDVMR